MDFTSLPRALREWQQRRRARQELRSLPDRQLADMGLDRSMIDVALRSWLSGLPHRG